MAMPFALVSIPSIQIGTLASTLAGRGSPRRRSRCTSRSRSTSCAPGSISATTSAWRRARGARRVGLAVPPFGQRRPIGDVAYLRSSAARMPRTRHWSTSRRGARRCTVFARSLEPSDPRRAGPVVGLTTTFVQTIPCAARSRMAQGARARATVVLGGGNCDGPMGAALHRDFAFVDVRRARRGRARSCRALCARSIAGRAPPDGTRAVRARRRWRRGARRTDGRALPAMDEVRSPTTTSSSRGSTVRPRRHARPAGRIPFEARAAAGGASSAHCTFCGLNGTSMAYRSKPRRASGGGDRARAPPPRTCDFRAVDNIIDLGYIDALLAARWPRAAGTSSCSTRPRRTCNEGAAPRDARRRRRADPAGHREPVDAGRCS